MGHKESNQIKQNKSFSGDFFEKQLYEIGRISFFFFLPVVVCTHFRVGYTIFTEMFLIMPAIIIAKLFCSPEQNGTGADGA